MWSNQTYVMWIDIWSTKNYFLVINDRLRNSKFWNCVCPGATGKAWIYLHLLQYHQNNIFQSVRTYRIIFENSRKQVHFQKGFKTATILTMNFLKNIWCTSFGNTFKCTHRNVLYQWQYNFFRNSCSTCVSPGFQATVYLFTNVLRQV